MKKCPYCAEEIQDEAILCRYCGSDLVLKKTQKPKKKNTLRIALVVGILTICVLFPVVNSLTSQSVRNSSTNSTKYTTQPTSQTDKNLCDWFMSTQYLRAKRISGLNEFNEYAKTHDLYSLSDVDMDELIAILIRHRPHQEEFIREWKELGPIPDSDATLFWRNEFKSVEMKIQAIYKMNEGKEKNDIGLFDEGWELFVNSQDIGREGNYAGIEIEAKCFK